MVSGPKTGPPVVIVGGLGAGGSGGLEGGIPMNQDDGSATDAVAAITGHSSQHPRTGGSFQRDPHRLYAVRDGDIEDFWPL